MVVNGIIMFLLGAYFWAASQGKVQLNRDPVKNAEAMEKFAPVGRTLAPVVTVAGALMVIVGFVS